MKRLILSTIVVACGWSCGCTTYTHERSVDPKTGVVSEKTSLHGYVSKVAIANLKTSVTDSSNPKTGARSYSRRVGLDSAASTVDSEAIAAFGDLLEKATKGAAAGAMKP